MKHTPRHARQRPTLAQRLRAALTRPTPTNPEPVRTIWLPQDVADAMVADVTRRIDAARPPRDVWSGTRDTDRRQS